MTIKEPYYVERLARDSGLTWLGLASRLAVNDRRRLKFRPPARLGHQRESGANGRPDSEG